MTLLVGEDEEGCGKVYIQMFDMPTGSDRTSKTRR